MAFPDIFQLLAAGALPNTTTNISQEIYGSLDAWAGQIVDSGGGANVQGVRRMLEVQARGVLEDHGVFFAAFLSFFFSCWRLWG